MNDKVKNEILSIYNEDTRNLNYRASEFVNRDDAIAIMAEATPHGYNAFEASLLKKFPKDTMFLLGREYSVCIYVSGKRLPAAATVEADEKSTVADDLVRYWWD